MSPEPSIAATSLLTWGGRTGTKALIAAAALIVLSSELGAASATRNPSGFSARVDNRWFPLRPGSTYVYRGAKDGERARETLIVTRRTKTIEGAPCVVLEDRLYLSGVLRERTTDWYTQDGAGNVWYFGEATAELDKRHVTSTEGSWQAGRDGAKPGIFMPAHPRVGQSFRQEFLKGQAEDHFRILSLHATAKVPFVSSERALLTKEWTPLEPGVIDHKLYVRGIGTVFEQAVKGGTEQLALVSLKRGGGG